MSEEQEVSASGEPEHQEVAEQAVEPQQERMVPLAALEAERRKRQEREAENRIYQEQLSQQSRQETVIEDDDDWVTKKEYRKSVAEQLQTAKRDILEESFVQSNPDAYRRVSDYLPELIKKKPWVKEVIENAPNRWQRAWELIQDLEPREQKLEPRQQKSQDAQRIIENAGKPRSPATANKSAAANSVDYLRSIRGTSDWDAYRANIRNAR